MSDWDFDLLGDRIPEGFGRRGRPPHVPSDENRQKVILLAAFDKNEEQIAAALSITPPTLRKHYFRELKFRLESRQRLEGKLLLALVQQVEAGNVSAIDKLWKRLDRHDLALPAKRPVPAKAKKLGKKEQSIIDAREGASDSGWGPLIH
ncbi:hypothetical protein FSZ31_04335 [Sphingorhabdus soli]|uniref:Uncharacterized protein n=1 Tax=Flavisphingopyxis soli TaxID=2601267 RepID=A0A5C6UT70_9SPHN|nr:hypothetical protein [Sphingorhabdus soli]TXC73955.1 hypothetical protein FSZ31_04335 [Sphingorhabdus soli]